MAELEILGYRREDFRTKLTMPGSRMRMLGIWGDANFCLYRHKHLQFDTVFALPGIHWGADLVSADADFILSRCATEEAKTAFLHLRENYDCIGVMSPDRTLPHLVAMLSTIPDGEVLFVPLANTNPYGMAGWDDQIRRNIELNDALTAASRQFGSVVLINTESLIDGKHEVLDPYHFDRMVYFRMHEAIAGLFQAKMLTVKNVSEGNSKRSGAPRRREQGSATGRAIGA
jgi:hypothetical protein